MRTCRAVRYGPDHRETPQETWGTGGLPIRKRLGLHWGPNREAGMERVKGIEPSLEAWEAPVLPLNYTRKINHFRV